MTETTTASKRIEVVDALRGFALLGIVLLHNIEHFNLITVPEQLPEWLKAFDKSFSDVMFYIFGGKAYAIFSLLFGFSFYIQIKNQQERGVDFRPRFAWRMVVLLLFGQIHSLFYPGDILTLYAFLGFFIIFTARLSDRALFWIAVVCMLQPVQLAKMFAAIADPDFAASVGKWKPYYKPLKEAAMSPELWTLIKTNIWEGQLFSQIWTIENGRVLQSFSLMLFGVMLGRRKMFEPTAENRRFWIAILVAFAVMFVLFHYLLLPNLKEICVRKNIGIHADVIVSSLKNFWFMGVLVSSFILLWHTGKAIKAQKPLAWFGRMSLTNYIMSNIVGVFIYYEAGLGLYKYLGTSFSFLVGVVLFSVQLWFSKWWLQRHRQGPLEYVWNKATWLGAKKK